MGTIALLGATGSLGRAMGSLLSAAGERYRAVSRSQMALQVRFEPDPLAESVLWDPEQPASIASTLDGVETAVYLVGMPLWEYAKHIPLTQRVIEAANQAGVKRLLLVSPNWAYGPPAGTVAARMSEAHPLAAKTVKGLIRIEQEVTVRSAGIDGPLETAILRIGDFYGPHVEASYLWSAFKAAKNGTHAQLMSPADTHHEFVFVNDAARTILRMLAVPEVWGREWNLGGAGVTSLRAMTEAIFAEAGRQPNYETRAVMVMR